MHILAKCTLFELLQGCAIRQKLLYESRGPSKHFANGYICLELFYLLQMDNVNKSHLKSLFSSSSSKKSHSKQTERLLLTKTQSINFGVRLISTEVG